MLWRAPRPAAAYATRPNGTAKVQRFVHRGRRMVAGNARATDAEAGGQRMPTWGKAGRSPGSTTDQVRANNQSEDREGAGHDFRRCGECVPMGFLNETPGVHCWRSWTRLVAECARAAVQPGPTHCR